MGSLIWMEFCAARVNQLLLAGEMIDWLTVGQVLGKCRLFDYLSIFCIISIPTYNIISIISIVYYYIVLHSLYFILIISR